MIEREKREKKERNRGREEPYLIKCDATQSVKSNHGEIWKVYILKKNQLCKRKKEKGEERKRKEKRERERRREKEKGEERKRKEKRERERRRESK